MILFFLFNFVVLGYIKLFIGKYFVNLSVYLRGVEFNFMVIEKGENHMSNTEDN